METTTSNAVDDKYLTWTRPVSTDDFLTKHITDIFQVANEPEPDKYFKTITDPEKTRKMELKDAAKTLCDTIFEFHPNSDPKESNGDAYFALSSCLSAHSHKFRRYILENRYLRAHRGDKDEESHYTIIRMPQEFELVLEPVLEFMHSGILKFEVKDVHQMLKLLLYFAGLSRK